ncbi:efflux transporter outer membrane subunit [Trinickia terrae]|uniref:Efflux transporter outer membrane subunit n=1 Tax=Trinickia terrae TaxID=2571161 RepID=A0A4U1I3H4_9BURK|nr:efflux transporter outer membrane subunit [Trinickia terrae]TKC87793.1 efflux transporter outer membrane subunit [Trinickia terrae]
MTILKHTICIALAGALGLMAGCTTVGHDFVAPQGATAPAYRYAAQSGAPSAARLPANWWTVFGDGTLDGLEQRAQQDSPSLKASAMRLVQAKAQLGNAKASQLPSLDFGASAERLRDSRTTPVAQALDGTLISGNQITLGLSMSYEVDIWGRVRRLVESADAQLQAAGLDHDEVALLLSTQIASTYWQLRGTLVEVAILRDAVATRQESRKLVDARFEHGFTNELDVSRATVELANAQADLRDMERRRNLLENRLATLIGASPSQPLIAEQAGPLPEPPSLPVGLPAQLLSQRPDLARSVALLRSANAQVGVAEAAFYPSVQLTGNFGYASTTLAHLVEGNSRQFEIGPLALSLPIFDGGRNRANLAFSKARYDEALADYQQELLTALREVEDALSDSEQRQLQAKAQAPAQQAAARAYQVALARYQKGLSSYLDVTDAQRSALAEDLAASQIHTQRLLASVAVVRAFGGGWQSEPAGTGTAASVQPLAMR